VQPGEAANSDFSDIILPTQLWAPATSTATQPEKRLMAAVLEEAISVLVRQPRSDSGETAAAARDASDWLASDARELPFSFASICDVLGLDADSVRAAVDQLRRSGETFVRPRMSAGRGRHRIRQKRRRSRSAA